MTNKKLTKDNCSGVFIIEVLIGAAIVVGIVVGVVVPLTTTTKSTPARVFNTTGLLWDLPLTSNYIDHTYTTHLAVVHNTSLDATCSARFDNGAWYNPCSIPNQGIEIPYGNLTNTTSFTLSVWAKFDPNAIYDSTTRIYTLYGCEPAINCPYLIMYFSLCGSGNLCWELDFSIINTTPPSYLFPALPGPPVGWNFYVGTFDSTTQVSSLYLNGVFKASVTYSGTIPRVNNSMLTIGGSPLENMSGGATTGYDFTGWIKNTQGWNYARNETQILADYTL